MSTEQGGTTEPGVGSPPHDVGAWITAYRRVVDGDAVLAARGRYYTCSFALQMGAHRLVVHMREGKVLGVVPHPSWTDEEYSFSLSADLETWTLMAQPVPPPTYQGIFAASHLHDLQIDGDLLVLFQHLTCFVRQHELLRVVGIPPWKGDVQREGDNR